MNDIAPSLDQADLAYGLDARLPDVLPVGHGTVLPVRGWCYSSRSRLARLDVVAGGDVLPIPNHSWGRPDIFQGHCPAQDLSGNSLLSGFAGFLPFGADARPGLKTLTLRATLVSGAVVERPLGTVRIEPGYGPMPVAVAWPGTGPRVAICMAAFKPPPELFARQIASIQAQTHTNWICIVNDDTTDNQDFDRTRLLAKHDPRFLFFQNEARLGFYRNFERALRRTPADADFVALCDQDDVWHPDKLRTLLDHFRDGTHLVYSDARIVDQTGRVLADTFWGSRRNNSTDLATMMVANTITGAATMIRASLLPDVLPFPEPVGPAFHDHWIGLVALLKGEIGYVDAALYDYVQHESGVIGHVAHRWPGVLAVLRLILAQAPRPRAMAQSASVAMRNARDDYTFVQQKVLLARTLLLRNPDLPADRRSTLERFARLETSVRAAIAEKAAAVRTGRPTLNLEGMLLSAIAGTRVLNAGLRYKQADLVARQARNPGTRLLDSVITIPKTAGGHAAEATAASAPAIPVLEFGTTKWIYRNIQPLTLDVSDTHPKRVNLLLATIDFNYVFGGYIGMFSLALRLRREGYRPRIILHEATEWDMASWRRQILKYPGVTTLFEDVEVILRSDRSVPVEVNPNDRFVATNCWAAHIAHRTAEHLRETRFLFMVQEYEPYFLPMNSIAALFRQAYDLPQVTLFSTELLQDFFRRERIGIYAQDDGDAKATVFSNAIQKFKPTRELLTRTSRRLLFYARSEPHAARNLFEMGMMALHEVVRDPRVDLTRWSFHGIGSLGGNMLEFAEGLPMELVPKTSLTEYIRLMSTFDVGLSLMMTPHPSLVPIEMASAGMWAVTNIFANKTAERLRAISPNLIGVPPTVDAIRDGVIDAMTRVDDVDARLSGARVNWPTDWADAFPAQTIGRIRAFLGDPC